MPFNCHITLTVTVISLKEAVPDHWYKVPRSTTSQLLIHLSWTLTRTWNPELPRIRPSLRLICTHSYTAISEWLKTATLAVVRRTRGSSPPGTEPSQPIFITEPSPSSSASSPSQPHPGPCRNDSALDASNSSTSSSQSPAKSTTSEQIDRIIASVQAMKQETYNLIETKKADLRALAESKKDPEALEESKNTTDIPSHTTTTTTASETGIETTATPSLATLDGKCVLRPGDSTHHLPATLSAPITPVTPTFSVAHTSPASSQSSPRSSVVQVHGDEEETGPWTYTVPRARVSTHGNRTIRRLGASVMFALFDQRE
ncbi:hypothetical protein PSPO01_11386 [Paraphaeosphaeria sporulosa]